MKPKFKSASLLGLGALLLGLLVLRLPAGQPSLKLVAPKANGSGRPAPLSLQLHGGSNGVVYVVQSSTNLISWQTVLAVKSQPGGVVNVGEVVPSSGAKFFRLFQPFGAQTDTNAPVWTNGVNGSLTVTAPSTVTVNWAAAVDDVGVAEYRIYLNGTLVSNVSALTLSYQFTWNLHKPVDIRIQAADASDNVTPVLPLLYMPGDGILAVSDDNRDLYVFEYLQTNIFQTNLGFNSGTRIATVNAQARGVGIGDFDRDGVLDIIAGGVNGDIITPFFFKGKGDGTFFPGVAMPTAPGANSYMMDGAVGDFDGDGNLDFVVGCNNASEYFYWGNGDGTFTLEVKSFEVYGRGTASGDFNEDGREDIVRADYYGNVRVYLSNGDRTFTDTNLIGSFGSDRYGLAAGDFDEDGHLDVIANNTSSGDNVFYKGFGDGTFTALGTNGLWANLDVHDYSAMDAYDYDGDGHLDLVMSTYSTHSVYFFPGIGDGTFSSNRVTVSTTVGNSLGISAPPHPPRVDVNITPLDPVIPLSNSITYSAFGTGVSAKDFFTWSFGDQGTNRYAWTFGTNSTNMGPTVTHFYTNEGRFVTRLLHTDSNGVQSVRGTYATVQGAPPVANPGGPYNFDEHAAFQGNWTGALSASNSTDDFGIAYYFWNFGDGTFGSNSSPAISHTWTNSGVWNVTLIVADAAGQTDTNSTTVTFTPGAFPVAVITGTNIIDEKSASKGIWSASFSAQSSTDDVGIWKYLWNFGNGQTSTSIIGNTTYNAVGTYVVSLTVTDNAGQTNIATLSVTVKANGLPVPVINGPHLLSVNVSTNGLWFGAWDGLSSTDDTGIYIYAWNFGDGATATGASVTHNYAAQGVYPLVLTVTDNGNQSVSVTQKVVVVAGNPPVARITASTLAPEGSQPVMLSGATSTSDNGIYLYEWFLPPRTFDFVGQFLDPNQWLSAFATQNGKMIVNGQNNWGVSYFFSIGTEIQRGGSIQGRVDTPSAATATLAMVGLKNLNATSGQFGQFGQYPYAIYFDNGAVQIYEDGNGRGTVTNYNVGTAYDFRIETKPGAGARYYLRPSGAGQPFVLIFDSPNLTDAAFSFGADVNAGVWGFENFQVDGVFAPFRDITTPITPPGGTVTLEVVDSALLTNSTSIVITPVTGSAPVAVIAGPTTGLAGVELAFNGYGSTDDHGIALYTWDFGDGTPVAFGPAPTHHYGVAGTYTNTLTVMDYAEQTSVAQLVVNITGSNSVVHVPWLIINGIEQSHVVYSGKTNTLKAVARGLPVPFTYTWDYGDGTGIASNSVTASAPVYNLEAQHAYVAGNGTPFYAIVTVLLTNGTVFSDTYPITVQPDTLDTEEKVAIDEGLWYLQKAQNRYDFDPNTKGGDFHTGGYKINATASAVQAFGVNGHLMTDDAGRDPYVDTVQRGVNFLLNNLTTVSIGSTPYGNPDGNNNGIGLNANSGYPIYETGPILDSFVAVARPELVAPTGGVNVKGRAFKDIEQDMIDMFAWGQYQDPAVGGGWRYGWQAFPDNSASQWGAIGMLAAERFWGLPAPSYVKPRNEIWLSYSEGAGGFGYTGPGDGYATTPSALVQMSYDGINVTNPLWMHGESYVANNWDAIMGGNNVYANYAIAKGLRTANPVPVHNLAATGKDWFLDPVDGLAHVTINHQQTNGGWTSSQWVSDQPTDQGATAWSILILSSSLFQQGPVAVITVSPNPSAVGFPVVFDGRGSYHQNPNYKIIDYRWIFDASKGLDFTHPDAIGPVVTNIFSSLSTNTVFLEVLDNGTPQLSDTASVVVDTTIPPFPPTADAGGPYVVSTGQPVHLDGSGSFTVDASAGNFIQSWDWEVNYAVPVTFDQGVSGEFAVYTNGYPTAGTYQIGLQVKNANSIVYPGSGVPDETADAFTTVLVYDQVINDLRARPKATKIQLTWTKVGDYATISRSQLGPDHGFTQVGQTSSTYATFLDTNVDYNTEYYYRVYAQVNSSPNPIGVSDPVFVVSPPRNFDAHAPKFQSTPSRLAKVGQLYEVTLDAKDPENTPILYSLLIGPTNMTVNATNGDVQFTPTKDQVGNIFLSFQATNNIGRDVLSYTLFVFPATNHTPIVNANGPYAALAGQSIQFSSAGSMDLDGNPLRYFWNFGDGTISTNPNPTHVYGGAGNYLATLFVNNGFGGTASAKAHVQITRPDVPPIAKVSNPNLTVRLGETVTLDGSQSFSPLGNPITYAWNFGDGSTLTNASNIVTHLYQAMGAYAGTLTVTDNQGETNAAGFNVTVGPPNQPPVVVFTFSPSNPPVQSTVTFDATGTTSPDNDAMNFSWDFGDHSKTTGPLVTHTFQQISNFTVVLTVTDDHGGVSVATQQVQTVDAPPVFTSNPPLLVRAGAPYSYVPTVTDLAGGAVTFQLVQGPATMSADTNTGALTWLPGTNNLGPNPVDLRATDANGGVTDQSFTIFVTTPLGLLVDLQPTHIDMSNVVVDSQSLALSGTVRVYFSNNGADTIPIPFTISVFEDVDFDGAYSTNDIVVGYGIAPPGFAGGESAYVDMTVNGQALFPGCPLYAFVDSQNVVVEYDETNNILRSGADADTNNPPVVDLSASFLRADRSTLPSKAVLTARLGNSGLVSVPTNVPIAFYDGDPATNGALIGVAKSTIALSPGMYQDLSVDWPAPTITNHTIYAVADDPGNSVYVYNEITYSNNILSVLENLAAILPPVAYAGPNQNVFLGDNVQLNGRGSQDPQGRPLTYLWSMLSVPIGSATQLTGTNTISPSFRADVAGLYSIQLVVNNGILNSSNSTVMVLAIDTNVYTPPTITSTPSFQAIVSVPYAYAVQATDPQNGPLSYRLPQSPPGMTINTNTGLVKWTPTNAGNVFVQVAVDGRGGSFYQGYTLSVIPFTELPPQFTSTPVTITPPSVPYAYTAVAVSPVANTIAYSLTQTPSGMSINAQSGAIAWTPTINQLGGNPVTILANDGHGGTATQSFSVVVLNGGTNAPVVQPIPDQTVTAPANFVSFSLDNYVHDPHFPANQITWTVTGTNLLSVAIDSNRVVTITYPAGVNASEQLTFFATDPSGFSGFASPTFTVVGSAAPPVAAIANLSGTTTTSINTVSFQLLGTADDPGVPVPVAYRIGLYAEDGSFVADVTPGPVDAGGWHEGRVPAGGSLGNLDFTLIRAGDYSLELDVEANGFIASATAQIALNANFDVGQLEFSQQDVALPVQGIGLQVTRNYNSLKLTSGDFGYGWTYSVADLDATVDDQRVNAQDENGVVFSQRVGGSWDVTLNMPDTGRRVTFTFGLAQGQFSAQAYWAPPPGISATLVATVSPVLFTAFDLPPSWQAAGEGSDWQAFDWPGFILTTKDGTQYSIGRVDQGEHDYFTDSGFGGTAHIYLGAFLAKVTGTGGQHTDFQHDGTTLTNIVQFDALNRQQKSILLQRDAQNRINAIYLPSSLDTNGVPVGPPSMTYGYDSNGNLVSADKLIDSSNPTNLVYATNSYTYGNPQFPHYITGIQNPRGVNTIQTKYDAQGRLIGIVDPSGKVTAIQQNLAAQTETVYDRLGNPTQIAYDSNGNIVVQVDALGGITQYAYDLNNNKTMQVDPLGNTNLYTYDALNNQLTHTDPLGNVTVNTYDSQSHLLTTTDPLGHKTVNAYDSSGNLTNTVDAAGNVTSYTYDGANNMTSLTDAAGNVTLYAYDSQGNRIKQTDPLGNVTTYTYDANGYKLSQSAIVTVAGGVVRTNVITSTFNTDGAPTSTTDAAENTSFREYDAAGNPTATVDALGNRTVYNYDDQNLLVQTVYSDGTTANYAYDAAGRRVSGTDRAGRTTQYAYDTLNRLITTYFPSDPGTPLPKTQLSYDAAGRNIAMIDELGNTTTYAYDAAGRRIAVTNSLGYVTTTAYDANGNTVSTTDALGHSTFYLYDALGRQFRTVFADGTSKSTTFDALGRDITDTDQAGSATHSEYDARGNLTAVVNPLGQRTEYTYDELGDMTSQRDANGHLTLFVTDPVADSKSTTLPSGQISTTFFDGVGNPTVTTNFNGQVVRYEYDANNRLAAERFPEGNATLFTYTPTGRRQTITDTRGVTRFVYDLRNRLLSRTDPNGRSIQSAYDAAGYQTQLITFDPQSAISNTQTFTYDALSRLQAVKASDGGVTQYAYDAANNLTATQLPNGTVNSNAYDQLNQPILLESLASTNVLSSYQYTLSQTGDRLAVQEVGGRKVDYAYDLNHQLLGENVFNDPAGLNRTNTYAYDPVGNRLGFNSVVGALGSPVAAGYLYDTNDQVLAETNLVSGDVTYYTYDNNGNTLSRSNSLQSAVYSWNSDNRLTAATLTDSNGVHQLAYQYDADHIRVGATIIEGGHTNQISYLTTANLPNAEVIEEWNSLDGQPPTKSAAYTYGQGVISQNRSGAVSFYHPDGLGSTRLLTDQTGLVTDSYDYDAFGQTTAQSGATANNYLFAGEQRDQHLGLDYLRDRYMSTSLGRFYGRDAGQGSFTDPATRHPYIYARNNPVNNVDPSGQEFLAELMASFTIENIIGQYQVALAHAGLEGILRIEKITRDVVNVGVKLQFVGLEMLDHNDPKGEDVFNLGLEFEQLGYTLLQSSVAAIELGALEIKIDLGFVQIQIGVLENKINIAPTKFIRGIGLNLGHNGNPDIDKALEEVLKRVKKESIVIGTPEEELKKEAEMDEDAENVTKALSYLLLLIEPGIGPNKFEDLNF